MILYGRPVKERITSSLCDFFGSNNSYYIAIIVVWDDLGSKVYIRNKQKYGESIGCRVVINHFEQPWSTNDQESINLLVSTLQDTIATHNTNENCIGIIIQLPLPHWLHPYQQQLCDCIDPRKDIDIMNSLNFPPLQDTIYPAVVEWTITLLRYYQLDMIHDKQISIVGQSQLVGKPLTYRCRSQWAIVDCFDEQSSHEDIVSSCRSSEYIFSATGVAWLIDHSCITPSDQPLYRKQVCIDIGYGFDAQGKAVWDMVFDDMIDHVKAITPVPGGIWPLCVASLFDNARRMRLIR